MAGKRVRRQIRKKSVVSRKIAAVLAGGLVLGIGAATTMAAWSDSQYASTTFTSGIFKLESRTDGGAWRDNTELSPGALAMDLASLTPGDSATGYLDIRTTGTSTLGGNTDLQKATASAGSDAGMLAALKVRGKALAGGTPCNAAALAGADYVGVLALPEVDGVKHVDPAPGSEIRYCLQVSMDSNAPSTVQGKSATLIWSVTGTSAS